MKVLSYTVSTILQQNLKSIESYRQQIVLYLIPPSEELRLRWEANINRVYYSLHLAHNPVTHKEVIKILTSQNKKSILVNEKDIISYKKGIDYITHSWLINNKPIMPQTIQTLYRIATDEKLHISETELMEILVFLQTSSEHPVVQAFIAYSQFTQLASLTDASGRFTRLLPYLFLYKAGLDFRGLLVIENYFYHNERLLKEIPAVIERQESMTVWIEHFVQGIVTELERIYNLITQGQENKLLTSLPELTERQKEIISVFDQPDVKITNRKVQEVFKISQITASRDLARLAALGFLFPYGKGRSVYYKRI